MPCTPYEVALTLHEEYILKPGPQGYTNRLYNYQLSRQKTICYTVYDIPNSSVLRCSLNVITSSDYHPSSQTSRVLVFQVQGWIRTSSVPFLWSPYFSI